MIRNIYISILLTGTCFFSCAQENTSGIPAFPGAEGFGRYTTGGRGGLVYTVTNLNDDGEGSLRKGIKKHGARIIVFAVSGNIELKSTLDINNDDITIAGQSAPGDGICIKNYPVKVKADNVIIRYMRFRLGDESKVQDDALSGTRTENVIIDHCSMSWSTDECASFYNNRNFTMQWCIISESLNASVHKKGDHGYGGIWGGVNASFHHNLIASHTSRLPRFSGSSTTANSPDELVDFRNNVIYNWKSNCTYGGEKGRYNMINNYYKPGPATSEKRREWFLDPFEPFGSFYLEGNYFEGKDEITNNNTLGIKENGDKVVVTKAYQVEAIQTQAPADACEMVLKDAGASKTRDAVDLRIIREVRSGTAEMGTRGIIDSQSDVGGWPLLKSEAAAVDKDEDGMPDNWEQNNGLDPENKEDSGGHSLDQDYTNIEIYLNSLLTDEYH